MRTNTKAVVVCCIILTILFIILFWRSDIVKKRRAAEKQIRYEELMNVRSEIQNIYTQMVQIYQEVGDHEARILKLEPESPTLQRYLKNVKTLTETINMHRRELKKWQKAAKNP